MVRPSIQPSCPNRCTKSVVLDPQAEASAPKNPMVGSLSDCCARAASGHAAATPTSVMNSRRLMDRPQAEVRTLPHRRHRWPPLCGTAILAPGGGAIALKVTSDRFTLCLEYPLSFRWRLDCSITAAMARSAKQLGSSLRLAP